MKPTRTHLVMVAAALSTIAIAAPLSTAGAATGTPVAIVDAGWGGSPVTLQASGPAAGQTVTVTGPTFITNAPVTATNTNTQVSSGDISSGGQVASWGVASTVIAIDEAIARSQFVAVAGAVAAVQHVM